MAKEDIRYFTFPIALLENAFEDIKSVCNQAIDYTIYTHSLKLEGNPEKQMKASAKYFNVELGSWRASKEAGERIANLNHVVITSIKTTIIWDFYSSHKSHSEIAEFLAFCSIRSILGQKPYCKTNNQFVLSRMAGFEKAVPVEILPPLIKDFANEYQMKKLKNALIDGWGMKHYGRYMKGFCVSFTMDLNSLVLSAEKKRKKFKDSERKKAQDEALKNANSLLYGGEFQHNDQRTTKARP